MKAGSSNAGREGITVNVPAQEFVVGHLGLFSDLQRPSPAVPGSDVDVVRLPEKGVRLVFSLQNSCA